MKISIITAVLNRSSTISQSIDSVRSQIYNDVEHVVIDGGSTDGTLQILEKELHRNSVLVSEPDSGIYDALNKGLHYASGDVIGFMHSDDFYADNNVLAEVASAFNDPSIDMVFGDLDYVAKNDTKKIIRHWHAGEYSRKKLSRGWMPPHPALFLRRHVTERFGGFDTRFRIAADYDAVLRYFSRAQCGSAYLPRVLVKMRVGGESNRSLAKVLLKMREDYIAIRLNHIGGVSVLFLKNLRKLPQFFSWRF